MTSDFVGKTFGGYQIMQELGRGGMATVYCAQQLSMQRTVALKVLPPQFLHDRTFIERFRQEAAIVARLEHRAIVPVHDYGEQDGMPYIVMRYMTGGSVDDLLVNGWLELDRVVKIVKQVAPALDYAHTKGVLHRDLKPSNLLLDANGDVYITDFGIARILGAEGPNITTSGVVGTPSYMSPEQAQGHALDGRSDVYALGICTFEMLTGRRPFIADTPYAVAVKHVTDPVPSAQAINNAIPSAVDRVIVKAMAKRPAERYQTAQELADALEYAANAPEGIPTAIPVSAHPTALPATRPPFSRNPEPAPSFPTIGPGDSASPLAYPQSLTSTGASVRLAPAQMPVIRPRRLTISPVIAGMVAGLAIGCVVLVGLTLLALAVLGDLNNQAALSLTSTAAAPLTITAKAQATASPKPIDTVTPPAGNTPPPHLNG